MNLRHLAYLRLVVEHGGFGAAAREAGVSQPAISQAMQALAREVGSPLFARIGRRLEPTEAARRLAQGAVAVQAQIDGLAPAATSTVPRAAAEVLRAGASAAATVLYAPGLHAAWCASRPRRRLVLECADEGTLLARLRRGELDLVIAPQPRGYDATGLHGTVLYMSTPQVYARRGHRLARARSIESLRDAAWAIVGPSVSGPVHVLLEAHRVRGLPSPRVAASCPDYESLARLVARSDLLCVVPEPVLLGIPARDHGLVPLRLRETLPRYDVTAFVRRDARAGVRALVLGLAAPERALVEPA